MSIKINFIYILTLVSIGTFFTLQSWAIPLARPEFLTKDERLAYDQSTDPKSKNKKKIMDLFKSETWNGFCVVGESILEVVGSANQEKNALSFQTTDGVELARLFKSGASQNQISSLVYFGTSLNKITTSEPIQISILPRDTLIGATQKFTVQGGSDKFTFSHKDSLISSEDALSKVQIDNQKDGSEAQLIFHLNQNFGSYGFTNPQIALTHYNFFSNWGQNNRGLVASNFIDKQVLSKPNYNKLKSTEMSELFYNTHNGATRIALTNHEALGPSRIGDMAFAHLPKTAPGTYYCALNDKPNPPPIFRSFNSGRQGTCYDASAVAIGTCLQLGYLGCTVTDTDTDGRRYCSRTVLGHMDPIGDTHGFMSYVNGSCERAHNEALGACKRAHFNGCSVVPAALETDGRHYCIQLAYGRRTGKL